MTKNVVLIGATGFVGTAILNELLSRGHHVTAIVRNKDGIKVNDDHVAYVEGDATSPEFLAKTAKGKDAIISAYNPGWKNPHQYEDTLENYPKIVEGTRRAGVGRLLIVGGAGTLFVKPGLRLVDTGTLPAEWLPGVKSMGEFYLNYLTQVNDVDWIFLSSAANLGNLQPGKRTGKYRVGKDDLLVDAEGNSFISVEDYAVAMVDELETPATTTSASRWHIDTRVRSIQRETPHGQDLVRAASPFSVGNGVYGNVEVAARPVHQRRNMRNEASATLRQAIFHMRRHLGKHLPLYQVYPFQITQGDGEHLRRAVRHRLANFSVALGGAGEAEVIEH